ncbi:MAG: hypothetical protein PHS42_05285 [Sulfurimonas sp.]|nr:hypothetical protein [Sulfurimonas sp.]MDD3834872.1 hypothetical protein [Sulfurimonas sp.]
MRTLTLKIHESIFEKVIYLLQIFSKNEVQIIDESATTSKTDFLEHRSSNIRKLNSISLKTKGFVFNREEANAR